LVWKAVVSRVAEVAVVGAGYVGLVTGVQTRSIQYVDDLVEGIVRLMKSHETRPVNLGNPVEMSVLQIAETMLEISGSGSPISFGPMPPGDPKRRCPDISRAREVLGWQPRDPAREGLQRALAWFAARLG
jgi:dTDP-glucose 4,6-dehydratase